MKLLYRDTRIIATATDAYDGPELFISVPDGFDPDQADRYRVVEGVLQAHAPSMVTMRQARLALLGAGLLPAVDAAVAAMLGTEGDAARIEWEYATTVERQSALVSGLSGALGLSDAQLDGLFAVAAGIQ